MKLSGIILKLCYTIIIVFLSYILYRHIDVIKTGVEFFQESVGAGLANLSKTNSLSSIIGNARYSPAVFGSAGDEDTDGTSDGTSDGTVSGRRGRGGTQINIKGSDVKYIVDDSKDVENALNSIIDSRETTQSVRPYDETCELRFNPGCGYKTDGTFSDDCYVSCA
tara:strand:+ start:95 stop:592 length:498 start_codon:yes stop_codon:yes gene_type:complete